MGVGGKDGERMTPDDPFAAGVALFSMKAMTDFQ
jgi:hypothetical protein